MSINISNQYRHIVNMIFKPQFLNNRRLIWGRYPVMLLVIVFVISSVAIFAHLRALHVQLVESTLSIQPERIKYSNKHPDTAKKNDVSGVDTVNKIFIQIGGLISLLLLIALGIVWFMIHYLRRSNHSTVALNARLSQQVEEIKVAEEAALIAKDEANLANRTKSVFLANISHEIRTPMNAIMGYCQILKRDPALSKDHVHSLRVIEQSSFHLLGLINSILDISKIESGTQQLHPVSFNLMALLQGLNGMFKLKTQQKGLQWRLNLNFSDNECWVTGDEGKLRQVLINIIGNAVKFTDQGFVQLSAHEHSDSVFYFEISDSGLGISGEDQDNLFTLFSQGQAGLRKGGTGLGLTISKKYLELMGTTLELKTAENNGAVLSFYLHLTHDDSDHHQAQTTHAYKYLLNQASVSVLVVDDLQDNRDVLTRILEDARFTVTQASNGFVALNLLGKHEYDLVLTDIAMPKIDGIQLLSRAKNSKLNRHTPMIAITASSQGQDRAHFVSLGFANYINKPFLIDDLFACIEQTIKVEFEYMDVGTQPTVHAELSNPGKSADPVIIGKLTQAAELYRISDIETILAELEQQGEQHLEFISAVRSFVGQYDMDKLLAFLQEDS